MASNRITGIAGEQAAIVYLRSLHFQIVEQNWRFSHYEIDVVAFKEKVLHFIEVKTRTSDLFGLPEESVSKKKLQCMQTAAEEYVLQHRQWERIQFDVLSVTYTSEGIKFDFFEDFYF